jgi:hypothetical protein
MNRGNHGNRGFGDSRDRDLNRLRHLQLA